MGLQGVWRKKMKKAKMNKIRRQALPRLYEALQPFYMSAQNAAFETLAVKRFLCNLHSTVPNARPNRIGSSTCAFEQRDLVVGSYVVSTISSQNAAHGSVYKHDARTAE
jgi:hypothetical protein